MMKKAQQFLVIVVAAMSGFILGRINTTKQECVPVVRPIVQDQAEVKFLELNGDALQVSLIGDVRVVWSGENFIAENGEIYLSQVPGAEDLKYREYEYTGNANTGKFYPSTTSWARGVRVKDRRFFHTKEEALEAGFIASKSVK